MQRYVVTFAVVAGILGTYSAPLAAEADVPALEHMLDQWAVAWPSKNALMLALVHARQNPAFGGPKFRPRYSRHRPSAHGSMSRGAKGIIFSRSLSILDYIVLYTKQDGKLSST